MATLQQRIGEYVLQEKIGSGATGEVWRAHHHVWADRLVAIKILTDHQHIVDVQRQEVLARRLFHPGIVRVEGLDPYSDPAYIAMEYVAGTSLRPWIESRSLSPADAVIVTTKLLEALSYAHTLGIVHGDVKPLTPHTAPAESNFLSAAYAYKCQEKLIAPSDGRYDSITCGHPHRHVREERPE